MFGKIKTMWQAWKVYSEVKDMSKLMLVKVAVVAAMAAAASAGAMFLETSAVNLSAVGAAVLSAIVAYLKQSPVEPKKIEDKSKDKE